MFAEEMQAAFRLYLGKGGDDEPPEQPPADFFGYSLHFIMETATAYEKHGILPYHGTWMDQPAAWVDALYRFRAWCAWVEYQYKDERGDTDAFDNLMGGDEEAGNWRDVFGD